MNTESSFMLLVTSYQQDECAVYWQRRLFQLVASTKERKRKNASMIFSSVIRKINL